MKFRNSMIFLGIFVSIPFYGCKDKRDLSPAGFSKDSVQANYFEKSVDEKYSNIYPKCNEFWFKGPAEDVKKAKEFASALVQLFKGQIKADCSESRAKAVAGCIEEVNLSSKNAFEGMKNLEKMTAISYYLGTDIQSMKADCIKGTDSKATFHDFSR